MEKKHQEKDYFIRSVFWLLNVQYISLVIQYNLT